MKICPFCKEEIKDTAKICYHCTHIFDDTEFWEAIDKMEKGIQENLKN